VGQWSGDFHVVLAGSNIYAATAQVAPANFTGPQAMGNKTINSPSGYMGVMTLPQNTAYDPSICAAACTAKSQYDTAHGLPSTSNPDICNFFVAYMLYKNGDNGVFTCTFYTSQWDMTYATNVGQYDSAGNHYTIGNANGFAVPNAPQNGNFYPSQVVSDGGFESDGTAGYTSPWKFYYGNVTNDPTIAHSGTNYT